MTDIEDVYPVRRIPLPKLHTFIGKCCREWVLAYGGRGTCGLCGERPVFVRHDWPPEGHHE